MKCPECGKDNTLKYRSSGKSTICDCGYDFKDTYKAHSVLPNEVVIKDINMSFGNMVVFMVKWAIAAIPAIIIITVIIGGAMFLVTMLLRGIPSM